MVAVVSRILHVLDRNVGVSNPPKGTKYRTVSLPIPALEANGWLFMPLQYQWAVTPERIVIEFTVETVRDRLYPVLFTVQRVGQTRIFKGQYPAYRDFQHYLNVVKDNAIVQFDESAGDVLTVDAVSSVLWNALPYPEV